MSRWPSQSLAHACAALQGAPPVFVIDKPLHLSWRNNRMIERLWRSLKYECVYLNAFETGSEMRAGIGKWLTYYNSERPHSTHGILTPDEAYDSKTEPMRLAA